MLRVGCLQAEAAHYLLLSRILSLQMCAAGNLIRGQLLVRITVPSFPASVILLFRYPVNLRVKGDIDPVCPVIDSSALRDLYRGICNSDQIVSLRPLRFLRFGFRCPTAL